MSESFLCPYQVHDSRQLAQVELVAWQLSRSPAFLILFINPPDLLVKNFEATMPACCPLDGQLLLTNFCICMSFSMILYFLNLWVLKIKIQPFR